MEIRKLQEWDKTETRERLMEIQGGKGYTIADIEALPEGERAELIDGAKKSEKGCQGAPDWIVEIASSSSVKMDYERKVTLYREAGVREYWIVCAARETDIQQQTS